MSIKCKITEVIDLGVITPLNFIRSYLSKEERKIIWKVTRKDPKALEYNIMKKIVNNESDPLIDYELHSYCYKTSNNKKIKWKHWLPDTLPIGLGRTLTYLIPYNYVANKIKVEIKRKLKKNTWNINAITSIILTKIVLSDLNPHPFTESAFPAFNYTYTLNELNNNSYLLTIIFDDRRANFFLIIKFKIKLNPNNSSKSSISSKINVKTCNICEDIISHNIEADYCCRCFAEIYQKNICENLAIELNDDGSIRFISCFSDLSEKFNRIYEGLGNINIIATIQENCLNCSHNNLKVIKLKDVANFDGL